MQAAWDCCARRSAARRSSPPALACAWRWVAHRRSACRRLRQWRAAAPPRRPTTCLALALDGRVIRRRGVLVQLTVAVGRIRYRRAPVSFSGERLLDWGGGVCQASTAVYNTALLAGLPIVERHRHHWATVYVPPGQDAAVAYPSIDLRFRNTLAAPIRVAARVEGESVLIEFWSRRRAPRVHLDREGCRLPFHRRVRPADSRHRRCTASRVRGGVIGPWRAA
jgi:hypothetical protein